MKELLEQFFAKLSADGLVLNESANKLVESLLTSIEQKISEAKSAGEAAGQTIAETILLNCVEAAKKDYDEACKLQIERILKGTESLNEAKLKLALKKQDKEATKKMSEHVDTYINMCVKELLPETLIVNYAKMNRQQKLIESMKRALLLNDEEIREAAETVTESIKTTHSKLQSQLDEQIAKNIKLTKIIEDTDADKYLAERLKDVPQLEAKKMQKYFTGSTTEEIKKSFEAVYNTVKKALSEEAVKDSDLETEIKEIIDDTTDKDVEDKEANTEKKPEDKPAVSESMMQYIARFKEMK